MTSYYSTINHLRPLVTWSFHESKMTSNLFWSLKFVSSKIQNTFARSAILNWNELPTKTISASCLDLSSATVICGSSLTNKLTALGVRIKPYKNTIFFVKYATKNELT